jgi:electron transfer flavoprotein alpha subunit
MVLVYIDQSEKQIKKSSYEALSYGVAVANQLGIACEAIILGSVNDDVTTLGKYGVQKVHQVADAALQNFDVKVYSNVLTAIAKQLNTTVLIFAHNINGKALAPAVAVKLEAGIVTGANALPKTDNGFVVTKSVFSGKAVAGVKIETPIKVIAISQNCFGVNTTTGTATINPVSIAIPTASIKITKTDLVVGEIPLSEASIVVSAGRGLKGPENWGMIETLAKTLGAATACSRPVSDADWRPHHEHVGQTGLQIAPNLYIAVGISGAIQHLAGVNRSKTIVVINKDPEAPFFKSADYGVVGDAFEVVPALNAAILKSRAGA